MRKPLTGIITGYHVLPYILVAPEHDHPARAVEIRGRIKVSPRLVIAAGGDGPTYGELFGERELMDQRLVARVFSFRYASRVALESEDLAIRRHDHAADSHLDRVLDELSRREIIDTGVIVSPDARFYPAVARPVHPRDPGPGISRVVSRLVSIEGSDRLHQQRVEARPRSRVDGLPADRSP